LFQRVGMGEPEEEFVDDPNITDVNTTEWIAWAPFLALIVLFGFLPGLIFDVTDPAVVNILDNCLQNAGGCTAVAQSALGG